MTAGALLERGSFVALGVEAAAFASVDLTLTGAGVLVTERVHTRILALDPLRHTIRRSPWRRSTGFVARVYDAFGVVVGCF